VAAGDPSVIEQNHVEPSEAVGTLVERRVWLTSLVAVVQQIGRGTQSDPVPAVRKQRRESFQRVLTMSAGQRGQHSQTSNGMSGEPIDAGVVPNDEHCRKEGESPLRRLK
jgi:hypothetical protein